MAFGNFSTRYLLLFGGLFLLTSTAQLYRFLHERSNIWWTPQGRLVPLAGSHDRVEIYARGRSLGVLLDGGQVQITPAAEAGALRASEVGLRFNNWDRVRAERLPGLLIAAATAGAAAVLVLLGLVRGWPRRGVLAAPAR